MQPINETFELKQKYNMINRLAKAVLVYPTHKFS